MSFNYTAGQLIRISPEVIPETAKDDELLGELGVPGLMRHAIFEIIEVTEDPGRGPIALCRMTNPEVFKSVIPGVKEVKYEGELVLLLKEIVPANMKTTLNYIIETGKTKEQMIKELFATRKALEARGLDKKTKEMRANWKEIQVLRGEVKGPMPASAGKVRVSLPDHRSEFPQGIEFDAKDLPGTDEESINKFKRLLSNKLRGVRSQRRVKNVENKVVFGFVPVQKMGGVYLKENSLLKAYEEMMKTTLETDKKPTDAKATYVGVEIEFIYTGRYDELKRLLIENKLHKYVCLKDDGSLRQCHNTGSYRGKELTLICKNTEVEYVLKRLDRVLANPIIDGYANRSCGLHVHLDVRNRDADLVYKNLVRIQNILRGSQPVGRINNIHCKPNTSDKLDKKRAEEAGGRDDRYWVVNGAAFARHKSIEIRIHEGTVDCENIYNWVSFLDAIASHTKEIPKNELKYAEDLSAKFDVEIPLHAIDYVDRRIEKFNSLTAV
jgi:hypothetical protein